TPQRLVSPSTARVLSSTRRPAIVRTSPYTALLRGRPSPDPRCAHSKSVCSIERKADSLPLRNRHCEGVSEQREEIRPNNPQATMYVTPRVVSSIERKADSLPLRNRHCEGVSEQREATRPNNPQAKMCALQECFFH